MVSAKSVIYTKAAFIKCIYKLYTSVIFPSESIIFVFPRVVVGVGRLSLLWLSVECSQDLGGEAPCRI